MAISFWVELFIDLILNRAVDFRFNVHVESAKYGDEDFSMLLTANLIACIAMSVISLAGLRIEE